jgi:hypothetical protein
LVLEISELLKKFPAVPVKNNENFVDGVPLVEEE